MDVPHVRVVYCSRYRYKCTCIKVEDDDGTPTAVAVAAPKKNTFNAWQDSNDVGLLSALICCVSACAPRLLRARYQPTSAIRGSSK